MGCSQAVRQSPGATIPRFESSMFYAYVLKSLKNGSLYFGNSYNPRGRLEKYHNRGQSPYTKNLAPWILVYKEPFRTKIEAMKRERFFKTGKGREYLKKKIK